MRAEKLNAHRYVIQDIAIIEIFNPDTKVWEYFVSRKDVAGLEYSFGTENRFASDMLRELWKNGYFEK